MRISRFFIDRPIFAAVVSLVFVIVGAVSYGRLPVGWPDEWVYKSAFGDDWKRAVRERREASPLDFMPEDDLPRLRSDLAEELEREPTEEEFVLFLMHPKDALDFIRFRETYGEAPIVLPTSVWRRGLARPGDKVEFELWGKPYCVELVSRGGEHEGIVHVVVKINNRTHLYEVQTPRARPIEVRKARAPGQLGAPMSGSVWRIGNPGRGPVKPGDIVHQGEEIANLEAMKMENAILAPFDGQVVEVCVRVNEAVVEGQLLFILEKSVVK